MLGMVPVKTEHHEIDQFYSTVMSAAKVISHHIGVYMAPQWGLTVTSQPCNKIFDLTFSNPVSSTFGHKKYWNWIWIW